MQLWVGLGNPGRKYAANRHNVGWMALEAIAADHGFGPWRTKFQGRIAEGVLGGEKVVLLKPETFMNLSGQSVGEAMRFFKLAPGDVTVFHDELDLAPGKLRVKQGGGHAGHNGLRSMHQHIGAEYARVRIGIGHPGHKDRVAGYVLSDFAKAEAGTIDDILSGISDGARDLATGETGRFQNAVALRVAPPRSSTSRAKPAEAGTRDAPPPGETPGKARGTKAGTQAGAKSGPDAPAPPADARSALQRLVDRFK